MVWRPFLAPRFDLAADTQGAALELPRGHVPALDAIRGLAIVVVTLYRFGGGGEAPARALAQPGLVLLGGRGVDLFFVLSGFLITGILFDSKGQTRYFRNFYMRRTLRIFPLYYAALLLTLLALPQLNAEWASSIQPAMERQGWLWLYGANAIQSLEGAWCLGPLNHFWSLAIEEHFYLLWPLAIFWTSRRGAMALAGGLVAASTLARAAWLVNGGSDVAAEVFTPLRMDGLALGSWLALAARSPDGWAWLVRWSHRVWPAASSAAVLTTLFHWRLLGAPSAVWSVACGALLIQTLAAPRGSCWGRIGGSALLQFFGKYSYAMYVVQLPLVYFAAPVVTASGLAGVSGSAWVGQTIYCALMFAITTLAAVASWHGFEKQFLTFKHRFGG
jgi:peptidoglycan/LPS O-acetylase OafA/YrhL